MALTSIRVCCSIWYYQENVSGNLRGKENI
uniref:Uncharacterized protein n=1 Tax=Arundo donax TaxID=35708 RepID=A0A0A9BY15_ARUDO